MAIGLTFNFDKQESVLDVNQSVTPVPESYEHILKGYEATSSKVTRFMMTSVKTARFLEALSGLRSIQAKHDFRCRLIRNVSDD